MMAVLPSLLPLDVDGALGALSIALARIPEHCRSGLLDYLRYGQPPGHFLRAVLSNDLKEACARADDENQRALYDYIYLLCNYASAAAWGSPEKVEQWIARGEELRKAEAGS